MKNTKNMKNCENYEKLIYLNAHLNYFRLQPNFLYFTAMRPAAVSPPAPAAVSPPAPAAVSPPAPAALGVNIYIYLNAEN